MGIKKTLEDTYPQGVSSRYKVLDAFDRMLDGTLYEEIKNPYDKERQHAGGRYIPLEDRRPSVVYNLARVIVDQCAALTFSEGHSPHVRCWDKQGEENPYEKTEQAVEALTEATEIDSVMMTAVVHGSVGSCAVVIRALPDGAPHISIVRGKHAKPVFNPRNPNDLVGLIQQYPVKGVELVQRGYDGLEDEQIYWLRSTLDAVEETWFLPLKDEDFQRLNDRRVKGEKKVRWVKDDERSNPHAFGVVPAVWIRNSAVGDNIDGPCTFGPIVDLVVKCDYLLSQLARGVRFSADPMLVISKGEMLSLEDADGTGEYVKDAAQALQLNSGETAALLESTGSGLKTGKELVERFREFALEVVSGMRSDAESASGPQSGKALEILHQALVWLVERMRLAYGNRGLVPVLRVLLTGIKNGAIEIDDVERADIDLEAPLRLVWPNWWMPRGADLAAQAAAYQTLIGGSPKAPIPILPPDTVTRQAAMDLQLPDPNRVVEDMKKHRDDLAQQQSDQADADAARATDQAVKVATAKAVVSPAQPGSTE